MRRKMYTVLTALITAAALTGCGSGAQTAVFGVSNSMDKGSYEMVAETAMANSVSDRLESVSHGAMGMHGAGGANGIAAVDESMDVSDIEHEGQGGESKKDAEAERKLIRNVHMDLKVEGDLQEAVNHVLSEVSKAGGYVEQNNSYFGDYSSSVNMVVRVPKGNSDGIIDVLKGTYKLIRIDDSVEDVTLNYTDIKTRLEVKRKTREKYMEYLERAENIEEIMAIEGKIADVTADIEAFESQMRVMDNQIDYTTIYVNLDSDKKQVDVGFGDRVRQQFKDFFENAAQVFLNMLEWTVYALIVLAFFVPLVALAIKLFIKLVRGKGAKKPKKAKDGADKTTENADKK